MDVFARLHHRQGRGHQIPHPRLNGHGLQAGRTEAVDRRAARRHGAATGERAHSGRLPSDATQHGSSGPMLRTTTTPEDATMMILMEMVRVI